MWKSRLWLDFNQFLHCVAGSHLNHSNAVKLQLISVGLPPSHFIKFLPNFNQFLTAERVVTSPSNASNVAISCGYPRGPIIFQWFSHQSFRWVRFRIAPVELLARVGIMLNNQNNSNICYLVQRTLILELSFDSESVKDFLAARHFPAEFQLYLDRAKGNVKSKQFFEAFHKRPSKQKFVPSPQDRLMNFEVLRRVKNYFRIFLIIIIICIEETFSKQIWFLKRTSKLDIYCKNKKAIKLQRD